jgi:hypothetical protein
MSRNYRIYDALAGGRNGTGYRYPHRGLPNDVSDVVLKHACWRLTDSDEETKQHRPGEIVVKRCDHMRPPDFKILRRGGVHYALPVNGYMHSQTWLNRAEIIESLQHAGIPAVEWNDYATILAQMSDLESAGKKVRLILWFDGGPMRTNQVERPRLRALLRRRYQRWKEDAEDFLKDSLARVFYYPRPFCRLKLPKGIRVQPFWEDKGKGGAIVRTDCADDERSWLGNYLHGDHYKVVGRDMHREFEKAYGPPIEVRELTGAGAPAFLRVYITDFEGRPSFELAIDSDGLSLHLSLTMENHSDIDKYVALFAPLWNA